MGAAFLRRALSGAFAGIDAAGRRTVGPLAGRPAVLAGCLADGLSFPGTPGANLIAAIFTCLPRLAGNMVELLNL
jgi:hypothetical protein